MIWMFDTDIMIHLINRQPGYERIARRMSGRSPASCAYPPLRCLNCGSVRRMVSCAGRMRLLSMSSSTSSSSKTFRRKRP